MSDNRGYYEIPHIADLALHVGGSSPEELLLHAAQGLTALMRCEPARESEPVEYQIELSAPDLESLLIDWLNEIIYLATEKSFYPNKFGIAAIVNNTLRATVGGSSPARICQYVKAATFHGLALANTAGYQVTIVFDV